MAIADFQHKMLLDQIVIVRDERQRQELADIPKLAESIRKRGLLQPIVIRRDSKKLIAGERRLTAFKHLRDSHSGDEPNPWTKIPFRYFDTLDESEAQLVELDENFQRVDLKWTELVTSASRIHGLLKEQNPTQTLAQSADHMNIDPATLSNYIMIAKELAAGNELVAGAATVTEALNKVKRAHDRAVGEQMSRLMSGTLDMGAGVAPVPVLVTPLAAVSTAVGGPQNPPGATPAPDLSTLSGARPTPVSGDVLTGVPAPSPAPVIVARPAIPAVPFLNVDFTEWAKTYDGEPFNFLHCDFPYGVNHNKSRQGRSAEYGTYADSEDVYWSLLESLAANKKRLLYPSSHIVFWFSMNYYSETMAFFAKHFPEFTFDPFPLIWWKDRSIAPDVDRRPRRCYETALVGFSGDRKLVNCRSNLVQAPCGSKIHTSEKSAQMLRAFFRMFVDHHTRMLDPTCGSGTSVRAARSLKAGTVLGIEKNQEFFESAVQAYNIAASLNFHTQDLEDAE